jgi:hypothetical protein
VRARVQAWRPRASPSGPASPRRASARAREAASGGATPPPSRPGYKQHVKDSSILKLFEFRILGSGGGKRCISTWRHGHGGGPVPPCSKALVGEAPAARKRPPWRCHPAPSLVRGARRRPPCLSSQALSPCPSVSPSLLSPSPSWQAAPSARPSRDAGSPPRADGGWRSRRGAFECKQIFRRSSRNRRSSSPRFRRGPRRGGVGLLYPCCSPPAGSPPRADGGGKTSTAPAAFLETPEASGSFASPAVASRMLGMLGIRRARRIQHGGSSPTSRPR